MPYSNIPDDKQPEMERCVRKVMADGHDKESAIAICYTSIAGKSEYAAQLERSMKIGARHSRADSETLQAMHDYAVKLGAMCGESKAAPILADDVLVFPGDAIKAVGNDIIEGYLVRWGNEAEPDISIDRDWFTKQTYFGRQAGRGVDVTLNHGIPLAPEVAQFSDVLPGYITETKSDEYGLLARAIITADENYKRVIMEMVKAGRLKWSSGALSHMVKRTPQANGTNRVDRWIIGEAALTPTPAEPRLGAITALKTLLKSQQSEAQAGSTRATPRRVTPIYKKG